MNYKKNFSRFLVFSLFFFIFFPAAAQEKTIIQTNQQWLHYFGRYNLSDSWSLQADASMRWREGFEERQQYVLRFMTSYRITPEITIAGGLIYSATYGSNEVNRIVYGPFQDVNLKTEFRFFELNHRIRVEERFSNAVIGGQTLTPNEFMFRFRFNMSATIPIFKLSATYPEKNVSMIIGDEIFLNSGKKVVTNVFDQNRIYLGPAVNWSKHLSTTFLWSRSYASTVEASVYRRVHIYWLQIRHQIN